MRENIDILGIFHDGVIVEIQGALPNISLRIEIEYLRNMFPAKGNSFIAHVSGCESIEFLNWESENRTTNLKEIESEAPEIQRIGQDGDIAHITCLTGELNVLYTDISFRLDTGVHVSYQELADACNKYWNDWERANS